MDIDRINLILEEISEGTKNNDLFLDGILPVFNTILVASDSFEVINGFSVFKIMSLLSFLSQSLCSKKYFCNALQDRMPAII